MGTSGLTSESRKGRASRPIGEVEAKLEDLTFKGVGTLPKKRNIPAGNNTAIRHFISSFVG